MKIPNIATVQRIKWLQTHLATIQDELREIRGFLSSKQAKDEADVAVEFMEKAKINMTAAIVREIEFRKKNEALIVSAKLEAETTIQGLSAFLEHEAKAIVDLIAEGVIPHIKFKIDQEVMQ